jgi:hypothetical protein
MPLLVFGTSGRQMRYEIRRISSGGDKDRDAREDEQLDGVAGARPVSVVGQGEVGLASAMAGGR